MEQMQHCLECMIITLMVVIFMSQTEELDHIANVLLRIVVMVMVISKLEYVKDFSCLSMANIKSKRKATVKTTEESFGRDQRSLIFKKTKSLFSNVPCQPQHQEISVYGLDQFFGEMSRNPEMPFHDKMKYEWLRLETFSRAPSKLNESAIKLAKDGLYYTGERKICKCSFCGQTFEEWNETDDLTDVHRQISPNCPLILNRLLPSNIAINSEFPLQESEGSSESSHSTVWYPYSEVKYPQYKNCVMRLVSFRGFCTDLTTILSLVKAGFFCTGKLDYVQCFHCGIKLQQWEKNDDPFVEHARFSPGCSYLRETVGQTFVDEVLQLISKSEKECFASSQSNATFRYTEKDKGPKYVAYALFGTRIKSFKGWPSSSVQHPEVLAKAGFYFTGSEDLVRCFFCGGGLKNWEAEDNAWVEHARWFPLCSFVRQKRGDAFVNSVCELQERRCTYGSQSFINETPSLTPSVQFNEGSGGSRSTPVTTSDPQAMPIPSQTAAPAPSPVTTSTTATTTSSTEVSSSTSTSSTFLPPLAKTSGTSSSTASSSSTTVGSESSRSRFDPLGINFEKPRYPGYETVRVNTYNGWPSYLDQTPRAMSLAGFFYAAPSLTPSVQFNEGSGGSRSTPVTTSDPQAMPIPSQTAAPAPSPVTTSTTATTTSSTEVSSSTSTSSTFLPPLAKTSGTSSSTASSSSTTVGSESSRSRFDPLGINFEKPRYPAYETVRVNTYNGWPSYLDQTPRAMSLAGFFYAAPSLTPSVQFNEGSGGSRSTPVTTSDPQAMPIPSQTAAPAPSPVTTSTTATTTSSTEVSSSTSTSSTFLPPLAKTSGTSSSRASSSSTTVGSESSRSRFDPLGINFEKPRYPAYETVRVNTYNGWPSYLDQTPRAMSLAGLFYAAPSLTPSVQFNEGSGGSRSTPVTTSDPQAMPIPSQTAAPAPSPVTTSTTATTTSSTEVSSSTSTSSTFLPPLANTSGTSSSTASSSSTTVGSESSRSRFDPLGINFEKPRYPAYAVLTVRVNTYNGWPSYLDQTPRAMSLAGFFYAGYGDYTRCFFCGGGLRNWEAGDDPWVEHARWFPKCAFLRQNQGDSFVDMVQTKLQEAESPTLCRSGLEAFDKERQQSVLNQQPVQMLRKLNVEEHHIKKAVDMYIKQRGDVNFNLNDLLEFIPNSSHLKKAAKSPPFADTEDMDDRDQLRQINEQRKDILRCVCCKQNRVSMVFENCGHNITCAECGEEFDICPKCGTKITTRFKTYLC